ncbi:adenine phosphoribosyltransferase [Mesorhizobium sp. KR9-304]|uniref:adenine phosphoribosyltransferase n=1 Tax=Mesorhizobium sp. KR9-304 TaxID=3156614 RepID=UPI0032B35CD9
MEVPLSHRDAKDASRQMLGGLRDVPHFPIEGILFKDIAPLLAKQGVLTSVLSDILGQMQDIQLDAVLGIDARGFVLGAALADRRRCGFVMVRKPGKLPGEVISFDYTCEYCSGVLQVTAGLIHEGLRCLVVDDLLATGGTARATADFVKSQGGEVVGYAFMLEIEALGGRVRLSDAPVISSMRC